MLNEMATHETPELKNFLKAAEQPVYSFFYYLLPEDRGIDEVVVQIFRDFSKHFLKMARKKPYHPSSVDMRVDLFRIAWRYIKKEMAHHEFTWTLGRDTRPLRGLDANLLELWAHEHEKTRELEPKIVERLSQIDVDFRVPVVLKDILKLEDEEIIRILGIRWAVYRHRLHWGRLELRETLCGKSAKKPATSSTSSHF